MFSKKAVTESPRMGAHLVNVVICEAVSNFHPIQSCCLASLSSRKGQLRIQNKKRSRIQALTVYLAITPRHFSLFLLPSICKHEVPASGSHHVHLILQPCEANSYPRKLHPTTMRPSKRPQNRVTQTVLPRVTLEGLHPVAKEEPSALRHPRTAAGCSGTRARRPSRGRCS